MPAVVLELELPRLPRAWEDGVDLALARMKRLKRRARINIIRKMAVLRSGFRDWLEGLRQEDEKPIVRKGEADILHSHLHVLFVGARVKFDDVNLED